MIRIQSGGQTIINGRSYSGNNITIKNGEVYVDGVRQADLPEGEREVIVSGDVVSVTSDTGNITVHGGAGSVSSTNGSVKCGDVAGSVTSVNGNITASTIMGNASSVNGNVRG